MTFGRALTIWLLMIPIAFANGILRQMVYGPRVGETAARQISCFTAIAAFGILIYVLAHRWRFASVGQAWRIGFLWAGLTAAFEAGLGRLRGMTWGAIFSDYAVWEGRLWGFVVAFILLAPVFIAARERSKARRTLAL